VKPAVTKIALATTGLATNLVACLVFGQAGFDGSGRYEIKNSKSGKLLELDRNHQWDIAPAGSGFYSIRNVSNGKALEVPLICARFDGNPNQQWRILAGRDGSASIVSRGGWIADLDSNQWFMFRRVVLDTDRACFYQQADYRGDVWCAEIGRDLSEVDRDAGSVRLFGHAQMLEVFERPGFGGERRRITHDERDLRGHIGSLRVQ
jgi:hypothetical protein